ncbi:SPOCS domain-containing protein [Haloimpatiens sp. FM7330]|uniref:DUF3794 and LysM peptidoglycan-binding domain-containing protein n=1 Tax=Haloimpatiens sp. FM7330 TaxID=3298610 RepID=UPI003628CF5D
MIMELVRENIEYEQLLGEDSVDTVVRQEHVIPDTHPDVEEILMVEAKPCIVSKEIMNDKIYMEGQIEYNILYLAKGERGKEVYDFTYTGEFSNSMDINGAEREMMCDIESHVEHIECAVVNERKIAVEGIIKLKAAIYKNYSFDIVKDIEDNENVELLKNPTSVDKISVVVPSELIGKSHMKVKMEKPEINNIMKCDVHVHKKDVTLYEGKIKISAMARIQLIYKGKDSRDINIIEDDVLLNKEIENESINPTMENYTAFVVDAMQVDVKEDDLGEKRIIDVEILVKSNTKIMYKEEINMIEDVYSPYYVLDVERKNYMLNVIHGQKWQEVLAKGEITIESDMPKPNKIILSTGDVCVTGKKIVEDKVIIEGLVTTKVLYNTEDQEMYMYAVEDGIPFTCTSEIPGSKIDMNCIVKANLENIEANIEPGDISIKCLVNVYVRVSYITNKDFIVDVEVNEESIPQKKASVTIYVVQNGDTLWKIAKKYNSKIEELARVNNIEDINSITVGNKLIIPGRAVI